MVDPTALNPDLGGPASCAPDVLANVYRALRLGSPRLAYAQACGSPLVPYSIRVVGPFTDVSQTLVPDVGNDVKIVQDSLIKKIRFQVQSQNPPSGQDSLLNFFYQYQSGILARIKTIAGGTGYNPIPNFTPINLCARELETPWLLTYNNGIVMDFEASVSPLPFPLVVTFVFEAETTVFPKTIDMTNMQAIRALQDMGFLCGQYERLYCT